MESWRLRSSDIKSASYWAKKRSLSGQIYHVKNNRNENALAEYIKEEFKPTCFKS